MPRTQPFRVNPVHDESVVSWLAAYAIRMHCTWGELLESVLPQARTTRVRHYRDVEMVASLPPDESEAIAVATHTERAVVEAMTLAGRYGEVINTAGSPGGHPSTPWGAVTRRRFCPKCLHARSGRDRLEWFLPWITVCPVHHCFLADCCPRCGGVQLVSPNWLSLGLAPVISRCNRMWQPRPDAARVRCMALLSSTRVDSLHRADPVIAAQQTLTEWITGRPVTGGIYAAAPATTDELLRDVLLVGSRIPAGVRSADLLALWGASLATGRITFWDQWLERSADTRCDLRTAGVAPAPVVSAWVTSAMTVLAAPSLAQAGEVLQDIGQFSPAKRRSHDVRLSTALTSADLLSRAEHFGVLSRWRNQIDNALPRYPKATTDSAHRAMLSAVRGWLWPEWCLRLDMGLMHWPAHCRALTMLLVAVDSTIPFVEVSRRMHFAPSGGGQFRDSLVRVQADPSWPAVREALTRLHAYLLDSRPPIDYQRRRDLNYDKLLSPPQWKHLIARHAIAYAPGPQGATIGRMWLTERMSGPPPLDDEGRQPRCTARLDDLRTQMSPAFATALDTVAIDYLRTHGIVDEPLCWTPPLTLLDGLELPGTSPASIDPGPLHNLIERGYRIAGAGAELGMSVAMARHLVDQHPRAHPDAKESDRYPTHTLELLRTILPEGRLRELHERKGLKRNRIAALISLECGRPVKFSAITALMHEYGISTRRRPQRPPPGWIYTQHILNRRCFPDIAAELGVAAATVGRWAAAEGIEAQRFPLRYAPDPRCLQLLTALGIDSTTCDQRLIRRHTWTNLRILDAASMYASLRPAARAIGLSHRGLRDRLGALEQRLGQQLIHRATRMQPMHLTAFGQAVISMVREIDMQDR